MFKFVVLCAFIAAATADPATVVAPLSYAAPAVLPAPAVYSSYPSNYAYSPSVVASAPLAYSSPYGFAHLIKKRSVPLVSSYIAPTTYFGSTPLVNSWTGAYASPYATYAAPLANTYSSPLYTAAHLIKKRSAPFVIPSTYVASTPYVTPYVAPTYAAGPVVSSPYYSTAPIAYSHFIKKRSVPLAVAYTAPTSYSHQSRFDYQATSPAISTTYSTYASPLVYPSLGYTHAI